MEDDMGSLAKLIAFGCVVAALSGAAAYIAYQMMLSVRYREVTAAEAVTATVIFYAGLTFLGIVFYNLIFIVNN